MPFVSFSFFAKMQLDETDDHEDKKKIHDAIKDLRNKARGNSLHILTQNALVFGIVF